MDMASPIKIGALSMLAYNKIYAQSAEPRIYFSIKRKI
jgi:hypothetical protein